MTIRTQTELLEIFEDGQAAGSITPEDVRDLVESLRSNQGNGWAFYADNALDLEVDAQAISADTRTLLTNDGDAADTNKTQISLLGANIWDVSANKIMPAIAGDMYEARVTFDLKKPGAQAGHIVIEIDVDGEVIVKNHHSINLGVGLEECFMFSLPIFADSAFVANGGEIYLIPTVDVLIWDIGILIVRNHTPTT